MEIAFVVFIFFTMLALIIALYLKLRDFFTQLNELALDPVQAGRAGNFDNKMYDIVIFGDSHASNWRINEINGMKCLNLGVSGQTTRQLLIRSDYELKKAPGYMILLAGANDARCVLTSPGLRDEIVNNAYLNITAIIKKYAESRIIVLTIPPVFKMPWKYYFFNAAHYRSAIKEINLKILETDCSHVTIFDAHKLLSKHSRKTDLTTDGIHINNRGYSILTENISKHVKSNVN